MAMISGYSLRGYVKISFFLTFDLENALIDPKINRLRPQPIPYHDAKHKPPRSFHVREKGGDRQTHTHTHTHTHTYFSGIFQFSQKKLWNIYDLDLLTFDLLTLTFMTFDPDLCGV